MISIHKPNNPNHQVSTEEKHGGFLQILISYIERYLPLNQFIKFCIVGGLGTLLNLFILYTSVEFFRLWYIFGETIAFIIVITFNFTLNKIWTFKNKERRKKLVLGQYIKYIIIGTIGIGINLFILFVQVEYLKIWYIFAEIIAAIIAAVWNFEGTRYIVFGVKKNEDASTKPSDS